MNKFDQTIIAQAVKWYCRFDGQPLLFSIIENRKIPVRMIKTAKDLAKKTSIDNLSLISIKNVPWTDRSSTAI